MNTFRSKFWSLKYPKSWNVEQLEEATLFFNDETPFVLIISAYIKDAEPVTEHDIWDFACVDEGDSGTWNSVKCGEFVGLVTAQDTTNFSSKKYLLRCGRCLVFATVSVDEGVLPADLTVVEEMLQTLTATSSVK